MVLARFSGSLASSGSGRPCPTSQNGQRRVHLSPMIMKVACRGQRIRRYWGRCLFADGNGLFLRRMSFDFQKRLRVVAGRLDADPFGFAQRLVWLNRTGMRLSLAAAFAWPVAGSFRRLCFCAPPMA